MPEPENEEITETDGEVLEKELTEFDMNDIYVEEPVEEPVKEPTEKEKALEAEINRIRTDKNNLKKALHEERQSKKKAKEETPELTEEQLVGLLEEYKDDPEVLLNTIKYTVEQMARGVKKGVLNETEVRTKQKEVNAFIVSRYPEMGDEDSGLKQHINGRRKSLGLDGHPFGDYFALGVQVLDDLPEITKYWYEEGKKANKDSKVEKARDKQIKDGELVPGGKPHGKEYEGLTSSQMETANRLGFKTPQQLKIYKTQILASNHKANKEDPDA